MNQLTLLSIAAVTAFSAASARAEEPVAEWRLLGPAFSKHATKQGAMLKTAFSKYNCRAGTYIPPGMTAADGERLGIPSQVCSEDWQANAQAKVAGKLDWDCNNSVEWTGATYTLPNGQVRTPSTYVCKFTATNQVPSWSSNNPALGLSYSLRYSSHVDQAFGTFVRDSYGQPSFMAGAGRLWTLGSAAGVTLDAGVVAGLWARSVLNVSTNELSRRVVPFVLPSMSLTESRTGLGLNVALAPKMSINGKHVVPTTTFMFQTTWLIKKSAIGSSSVAVEAQPGGGVNASFLHAF